MALRRFVIERDIPKVGTFEREQLRGAAAKSNEVLHQLGPETRIVVSEPLRDLPGAWNEVPESSAGEVWAGKEEIRPFRPLEPV